MNKVAIEKCPSYGANELDQAVGQLFDALSLDRVIHPGDRVLIKPNLIMKRSAEEATTTHPEVVAAIVRRLVKLGVTDMLIAESGGGPYTEALLKPLYEGTGFADMAEREGVRLNMDTGEKMLECPDGRRVKRFDVLAPFFDADVIISVPKLKSHCMMGLSGAVKNLFGFVPGLKKPELHCRFPEEEAFGEMLVDLCQVVRPTVSIVDAITCMEGDGPSAGNPRFAGMLIASEDPYALDLVGAQIIQIEQERVTYLTNAIGRGLCPADVGEIELLGGDLSDFVIKDFVQPCTKSVNMAERLPKFMQGIATKLAMPRPVVNRPRCIGCRKCAESCPMRIITMSKGKAHISYEECINCYCCHEMCPEKAIHIRRIKLFSL